MPDPSFKRNGIQCHSKEILKTTAKTIIGGLGGCSGLGYIRPAYEVGGIPFAVASYVAISSYTMWGGLSAVDAIFPEKIDVLHENKGCNLYNTFVYPIGITFLGVISLTPIGYSMYIVNNREVIYAFLPLMTDSWIRVLSLHKSFSQIQPTRQALQLFTKKADAVDPAVFHLFTHRLKLASSYGLQFLDLEQIKELLGSECIEKTENNQLVFTTQWANILPILFEKINSHGQKQNIFLMKEIFSVYLTKMLGILSASSIISAEVILSYYAAHVISDNFYLRSAIAGAVVAPIAYLQYLLVSGVFSSCYRSIVTNLFGVSTPTWLHEKNPMISYLRLGASVGIASISWGHILKIIDDVFTEKWLHSIMLWTALPSNCILLLAGLIELSEVIHIYLESKTDTPEHAQLYYKINTLVDEIESADPEEIASLADSINHLYTSEEQTLISASWKAKPNYSTFGSASNFFTRTDIANESKEPVLKEDTVENIEDSPDNLFWSYCNIL